MSEEKNNKNNFQNHDVLKWLVIGLICFILIILAFGIGVKVGASKARFSYLWADNYHRNFGGPRHGVFGNLRSFPAGEFINAHGSFGEVIKADGNEFVIKGRENVEKVIVINESTVITKGRKTASNSLKVGDWVVIIGSPNKEGKIEAKLIRILPEDASALPHKRSQRFPFF